ncbi:hypothetical protein T12_402 [Trichinella patagoniensis]|uniref:Uncharacterized protein n=1 Tax=Trichinella patagoniensis TaxID=990121 RepID=A0A0V0Z0B1_9BILA|nr:hypothetical protein T12_402 [Trichinella patagoniensis]
MSRSIWCIRTISRVMNFDHAHDNRCTAFVLGVSSSITIIKFQWTV